MQHEVIRWLLAALEAGRNPLTGLCGLQPWYLAAQYLGTARVAIPLRGYVVCNENPEAKARLKKVDRVAIPLRGYVVCNSFILTFSLTLRRVAIPLRGYVVCNSTPLRMPFCTALPEGGL